MKAALLIIDMQNDFVKEGALFEVKGIRKNIEDFKNLINKCREKGLPLIYSRHCYTPENNPIEAKLFPNLEKGGLRKDTEGWQIYSELKPQEGDTVIDKTRYDTFFKTELKSILASKNIDTVIITGTLTNVCCESTARAAMQHDFNVIFCSDLNHCSREEIKKHTLKTIEIYFGQVMSSKEILELINR
ncbi:MAG: cysteine hydrolase [Nanoarchaeota archaeon]|nr:cysteine hydrolase [Nanoarchaeota archaeon]